MNVALSAESIRSISWEIFGDEDLIFFMTFLGMPAILVVAYLYWRVRKTNQRLGCATEYRSTQLEQEIAAELSPSDDEGAVMDIDEMLAAARDLNAAERVQPLRLRRRHPTGGGR